MIVPTRSRPAAAHEAARDALKNADVRGFTRVYLAVDGEHDQTREYELLADTPDMYRLFSPTHRGMVDTLNHWARHLVAQTIGDRPRFTHVGFMGDDHRPRTARWDFRLMEAAGQGIAYGNDLIQGRRLPTAVVMHADIVRALGFMAPDALGHLYVDNYWLELGRALGQLHYLDDVVIEHMHPSIGKSPNDEQYRRVNSTEQFERDGDAWRTYRQQGLLQRDVETIDAYRCRGAGS